MFDFKAKHSFGGPLDSTITLFAGPDPADSDRVLIRKLVQINLTTYAYEETRINRATESKKPSVHKTITKISGFNLKEYVSVEERQIRDQHRPLPNIIGFSLYFRPLKESMWNHFSIVENTLWKSNGQTWQG